MRWSCRFFFVVPMWYQTPEIQAGSAVLACWVTSLREGMRLDLPVIERLEWR